MNFCEERCGISCKYCANRICSLNERLGYVLDAYNYKRISMKHEKNTDYKEIEYVSNWLYDKIKIYLCEIDKNYKINEGGW